MGDLPKTVLAFLLCATGGGAQVITTIAGTDFSFPPTPRAALDSPLGEISAIVGDGKGNLYLADDYNNLVFRITPDGTLMVVAGNGIAGDSGEGVPATSATIVPRGLGLDAAGNVYAATRFSTLRKVSGGAIASVPGQSGSQAFPLGAVDPSGAVYFVDFRFAVAGHRVLKLANGIVTTVAGTGVAGFSGDGGPATSAMLNTPLSLALDANGNLYISDEKNNRIRKVSPNGNISTVAGNGSSQPTGDGGAATNAGMSPGSISIDAAGNLFINDTINNVFRKVTGGIITKIAACCGYVDPAGAIYATGTQGEIDRMMPDGSLVRIAGNGLFSFSGDGGPATSASLRLSQATGQRSPSGIVEDSNGNVYVSDTFNHRIRRISNGIITTIAGNGKPGFSGDGGPAVSASLNNPAGLTLAANGDLYVADTNNNRVRKISGGTITTVAGNGQIPSGSNTGDGGPASAAPIYQPLSVTIDSKGDLYVCDSSSRIRKVSGGTITTVAGNGVAGSSGDGGPATSASIGAVAVAVDLSGNIYIADFFFNRVRKISNGIINSFAGNGTAGSTGEGGAATAASLYGPYALATDSQGAVYIADYYSQRVLKVANGNITRVAGNGVAGRLGDGGLATQANTTNPGAIYVDAAGNLLFTDLYYNRVREVLATPPSVQTSPAQLQFTGSAGGAIPPRQNISLFSVAPGIAYSAQADSNAPWLSFSPSTGALPRLIEVTADPSNLNPGTYTANITIATQFATPPTRTIAVSFTVTASQPAQLSVDKQSLSFPFPINGKARTLPVMVSNSGGGQLAFSASAQTNVGGNWLSVSPASGTALPNAPASVNVTADPTSLAPGTYTGTIAISGGGSTQTVAVVMTISAIAKALLLSQSGLSFLGVSQGGVVPPQAFGVINIGTGVVNWTVSKSTLSGGPDWLQVDSTSGASDAAASPPPVTVTVNPASLAPGKYYGQVRVDSPDAANSPQVVTIFLQVLPSGTDIGAVTQTAELLFATLQSAGSPGSQDLLLYNIAAAPKTFRSSVATDPGLNIAILPTDGTLDPQRANRIVVQPIIGNLGPGVYSGSVTLQFSDGRVRTVGVSVVVAAGGGGTSSSLPLAAPNSDTSCKATTLVTALTTLGESFTVSAGWPVALGVDVRDDCGLTLDAGSVTVTFSNGDPPLSLRGVGSGHWETTWQTRAAASPVTLKLQATDPKGVLHGERQIPGTLQTQTDPPVFDRPGIVAAAGGKAFVPLAPGSIVSIYGERLSQEALPASTVPLTSKLSNTSVVIGGQSAPLYYVSPGQVNLQVPYGVNANTTQQVLITQGVTYSQPISVDVAPGQPAVFVDGSVSATQGIVIAVRVEGGSQTQFEAKPGSPARAGDVLVIFCAGLGPVNPPVQDGSAPGGLSQTVNPVQVSIGGVNITPAFSGLTPGFVGLYQVNAALPPGLPAGDAVPLTLTVAGQTSPMVTIAVQ